MKTRILVGSIAMMLLLTLSANADGKDEFQKYFSNVASKVKATDNAAEKREILSKSFLAMSKAMRLAQKTPLISENDRIGIDHLTSKLQEKQDELTGSNGFERVSDAQLNAFSNYVVQDMEQAEMITISLATLLIIILLVVLLF
jgi:hypothetical protein